MEVRRIPHATGEFHRQEGWDEGPSVDREPTGGLDETDRHVTLGITEPLSRHLVLSFIPEGRNHHDSHHGKHAEDRHAREHLGVGERSHLRGQQADQRDDENVVVVATVEGRNPILDALERLSTKLKGARHEKTKITELNRVAPQLARPAEDPQSKIAEGVAIREEELDAQEHRGATDRSGSDDQTDQGPSHEAGHTDGIWHGHDSGGRGEGVQDEASPQPPHGACDHPRAPHMSCAHG
mmetsp:Transcript_72853/g.202044  ORF Transcript_72853/g.202044 Transcript_72853/m.202044 type:complete len:239 (+) Transcript_72853:873-1589(+)